MTLPPTLPMDALPSPLLAFGMPSGWEWIALLALGLLVFGRRLPEVGRSVGKSIVEFKKGIKGIEDDIDQESKNSKQGTAAKLTSNDSPDAAREAMYDHAGESQNKDS